MRGFLSRGSNDGLKNAVYVAEHIVVPEAQNEKAIRFKVSGSLGVLDALFNVLSTIELNN